MSTDPVEMEIEHLKQQIAELQDRVAWLRKRRSFPAVVPVLHYWRSFVENRDEALILEWSERPALEQAYGELEGMADAGACAPVGIEVGGYEFSMEDLHERFGAYV